MKRLGALGLGLWLGACGGSVVPQPTSADAARGSAHFPGLTLSELAEGRTLYVSRCGSCHALKPPRDLAPAQWQSEVDEMRSKNGVKLSDDEARAILRYLVVVSSSG